MKIGRATTPNGKGAHGPTASDWARKWIKGGVLAVLILAVLAVGQLQTPPAAEAQTADVVVKNTAKSDTTSAALNTTHSAFAQRFTATASAGAYNVDSIGIAFDEIANTSSAGSEITVTLNEETSGLPGTLLCTLNDPATFTEPFTAEIPMKRTDAPLFEYACHEGNYGMTNLLAGARVVEARATPKASGDASR